MTPRKSLYVGLPMLLLSAVASAQSSTHALRGNDVAIYNLVGTIRVEGGSGSDVQVRVTRRGRDAERLRIESGQIRGRETLRVIYPDDRIVYRGSDGSSGRRSWGNSRTTIFVDEDGLFGDGRDNGRGERVEISSDGRGMEAAADLVISVPRGKALSVNLGVGDATVTNVEGDLRVDVSAASLTTRGTRGRLVLDTGSGEISVTDASGEVNLDTGSGGVTVEGVTGPSLVLDAGSGSVRARGIEVDDLRMDTGSGRVTLLQVKARDLSVDTGSGSVEVELLSDVERLIVDSGSGGITIGVPSSLGAELSIETGSGGIDVDVPVTLTKSGRRTFEGRLGDGRGRMSIETGSGSIRIRPSRSSN